jgi:hypothetical protein
MLSLSRKTITAGMAAGALAALVGGTATPAAARGGWGGPFAAGVIGGAAVGALVAGATAPYYYGPPVAYAPPPCWFQRQPVYDYYGRVIGYQRVRVCR